MLFHDRRSGEVSDVNTNDDDFDTVLARRRKEAGLPVGRSGKREVTENREGEWPSKQEMWR